MFELTGPHNIVARLKKLLENCEKTQMGDLTDDALLSEEDFALFDEWLDDLKNNYDFFGTEGQCDPRFED